MKSTFWMTAQETEDYLKSLPALQSVDLSHIYHRPGDLFWKEIDPFQAHKPLFMLEPMFTHDLKRLMDSAEPRRYRIQVSGRNRYFPTIDAAVAVANEVAERTGIILGIEEVR